MENQETGLAIRRNGDVFVLPPEQEVRTKLASIAAFQALVKAELKEGHDYGKIPGCGDKPTLLKPGAEKIIKLLELSDQYEIVDQVEDWNKPFFRYLIKCKLVHMGSGILVSEGLGECNSMESKYRYRWVYENKIPSYLDKSRLLKEERKGKNGGKYFMWRLDNEDIYSQVNTLIKMAKKRSNVDAALSVGRLSELFTQDLEDLRGVISGDDNLDDAEDIDYAKEDTGHLQTCPVHHIAMVNGQYGPYCPTKLPDGRWCKGKVAEASKEKPATKTKAKTEPQASQADPVKSTTAANPGGDLQEGSDAWIIYMVTKLNIQDEVILNHFDQNLHIEVKAEDTVSVALKRLNQEQRASFIASLKAKWEQVASKA